MSSKLLAQLFLSEAKCKVILSKLSLYAYSQWDIKVGTFKKYGKKLSEWQCDRGKYQNPLRFELKGWGKAFVMFNHSWSLCMSLMTDVSVPFMTQLSLIKHYKKDHSNIQIFKAESGGKEGRKAPNTDIFFKIFAAFAAFIYTKMTQQKHILYSSLTKRQETQFESKSTCCISPKETQYIKLCTQYWMKNSKYKWNRFIWGIFLSWLPFIKAFQPSLTYWHELIEENYFCIQMANGFLRFLMRIESEKLDFVM